MAESNLSPGEASADSLRGTVEIVTFHNEENGYTVMKVAPEGARRGAQPITVIGSLPAVTVGEQVEAEGTWVDDRQYGRQFRADNVRAVPPSSRKGIERFLGSGLIEGIGKEYAHRLVEKFGTEIFEVLDQHSKRLEDVDGIGPKRRKQIKESWKRQTSVRSIMVFLHRHGVPTGQALRIYKKFGDEAVGILTREPYRLSREVWGIGFKSADEIARSTGIAEDAPARLEAGLRQALEAAADRGHAALPRQALLDKAAELLSGGTQVVIDAARLEPALDRLILARDLVEEGIDGERLVYLAELQRAEENCAKVLRGLTARPVGYPQIDVAAAIAFVEEKELGWKLADGQREAVEATLKNRVQVITGGPGVGKTTILQAVLKVLAAKKVVPVLCAPTGRAAKRLSESSGFSARTIHRLLEYQPEVGFTRNKEKPLVGDLFVVDELSMVDVRLLYRLLDALPENAHLLLVGDADQLPSVGPGAVLRDILDSEVVPVSRLTEIFRQAGGSRIVEVAHVINQGRLPPDLDRVEKDSDFFFFERDSPAATRETLIELVTKRVPRGFGFDPASEIQVLTPMHRGELGTTALNAALQRALNPAHEHEIEVDRFGATYRPGDRVIQLRNNYERDVFNGDLGIVRQVTMDPVTVEVEFDGARQVVYEPGELDELRHAWAITIHKSQGSEFPAVIVPVSTQHFVMLQRKLIYTAVTRGKRLVILVGERKAMEIAVGKAGDERRWTGLRDRLRRGDQL
jgi:exodeoxyribonuclease V alpha subunit